MKIYARIVSMQRYEIKNIGHYYIIARYANILLGILNGIKYKFNKVTTRSFFSIQVG